MMINTDKDRTGKDQETYFGDSNKIDPTPGWIPFVFVIAIAVVFLIAFVVVALFM